jgi:hypothetical protein
MKVTIVVPQKQVAKAWSQAIKHFAKKINVRGFRAGRKARLLLLSPSITFHLGPCWQCLHPVESNFAFRVREHASMVGAGPGESGCAASGKGKDNEGSFQRLVHVYRPQGWSPLLVQNIPYHHNVTGKAHRLHEDHNYTKTELQGFFSARIPHGKLVTLAEYWMTRLGSSAVDFRRNFGHSLANFRLLKAHC